MMFALSIITFVWESPLLQFALSGFIISACLVAGVRWGYLRFVMAISLPFYVILLLVHGFLNVEQVKQLLGLAVLTPFLTIPPDWPLVGGAILSREGLLYGLNVVFKTLNLTLVIPLAIFTTQVDNIIIAMVRVRVPYKVAFIVSATMRFFPLLFQKVNNILEAQRLRGVAIEKMNLWQKLSIYARLVAPLILSAMVDSQQLEIVLQSRAFSSSPERTYLHDSQLVWVDYFILGLSFALLIFALLAWVVFRFGTFGGPV
jgi:energy-coupling factor transport system permease protein